jgi:TolB-like protein
MPSLQLHVFLVRSLASLALLGALVLGGGQVQAEPDTPTRTKASSKVAASAGPTVAVLYFDYSGKDDELAFLRKGLTQMLVTDLSESKKLRLVERIDLESVMQELKLNRTNKIDRKSANRIGKLLGARYLVTGGYFEFLGRLRVDAKIINVETGAVKGIGVHRDSADFMLLEEELSQQLHSELLALHKIKSQTTRKAARKAARKGSAEAGKNVRKVKARTVARYGKALDAIDQGKKKVAMKELKAITAADPYFKPAAAELRDLLR